MQHDIYFRVTATLERLRALFIAVYYYSHHLLMYICIYIYISLSIHHTHEIYHQSTAADVMNWNGWATRPPLYYIIRAVPFFLLFVRLFLDLCTFSCSTCAAYNNGPAATLSIAPFLFLFLFFFLFFFLFLFWFGVQERKVFLVRFSALIIVPPLSALGDIRPPIFYFVLNMMTFGLFRVRYSQETNRIEPHLFRLCLVFSLFFLNFLIRCPRYWMLFHPRLISTRVLYCSGCIFLGIVCKALCVGRL
jgi:hypothetical protein